jgi:hypothetical protein
VARFSGLTGYGNRVESEREEVICGETDEMERSETKRPREHNLRAEPREVW